MKTSPTQRSLKLLRSQGYHCGIVEKWNPYARIRQDLFGFCDIVAVSNCGHILFVQTTSGANVAARIDKIKANPAACILGGSGTAEVIVHGWAKRGPRGKRKVWECRVVNPFEA